MQVYVVVESNDAECMCCNNEEITIFSTMELANAYLAASTRNSILIHTITLDDVNSKIDGI